MLVYALIFALTVVANAIFTQIRSQIATNTAAKMDSQSDKKPKPQRLPAGKAPPRTFRERIFHALPEYSGPYSVGTMEIEIPVRAPRAFSNIKRNHNHALRIDTVLFSMYYPCELDKYAKSGSKPSRATWLPRPRVLTCKGYAKFLSLPHLPVTAYLAATSMFTKLPAFRNATLANHIPAEGTTREEASSAETLTADDIVNKPRFPVIMFTHGLGGSRTCYSSICGELASHGFIVCAVEHRDGSGARSTVNIPHSNELADGKGKDNTKPKDYYVVDYIFPLDNAQDTNPNNARGVDLELRTAQIEMRMAEIEEAHYALELINNGQGGLIYKSNLRKKGNPGSSSKGLDDVDWNDWKGRMYTEHATIMGHSFGGATSVQASREHKRFPWIGQTILLDTWGPAIPVVDQSASEGTLHKPLICINSETFMHWPNNFERIDDICQEAIQGGAKVWNLTLRGSTHLSQTDFAVLYPNWMSWFIKTLINPRRAIHLTANSSLEYLRQVLPASQISDKQHLWQDEGILTTEAIKPADIPAEHKPDGKWTAARLKIDHEFRVRLRALYSRPRPNSRVALDARGKPLTGLVTYELGDEVWMHRRPGREGVGNRIEARRPTFKVRKSTHYLQAPMA